MGFMGNVLQGIGGGMGKWLLKVGKANVAPRAGGKQISAMLEIQKKVDSTANVIALVITMPA